MENKTLREILKQRLSKNSGEVLRALKTSKVRLTTAEERNLIAGKLDELSDHDLKERFNTKVLGALGIDPRTLYGQAEKQGQMGKQPRPEKHGQPGKERRDDTRKK